MHHMALAEILTNNRIMTDNFKFNQKIQLHVYQNKLIFIQTTVKG